MLEQDHIIRIKHGELATAISNPTEWYKSKVADAGKQTGGWSYDRMAVIAIHLFHKLGSEEDLVRYVDRLAPRINRMNTESLKKVHRLVRSYINWHDEAEMFETKTLVNIDWPFSQSVPRIRLGGQIARFDTMADGYRGVFLGPAPGQWERDTKMPLIQSALSTMFARPIEEIAVGYQSLENQQFSLRTFTAAEISAALRTIDPVIREISRLSGQST